MILLLSLPAAAQSTFGTLVLVETEPVPAGPSPLSAESPADWRFVELVYAPLFTADNNGGHNALLADRLQVLDGGKKLQVSLNDNAKWSAGRDIRPADVVYTYTLAHEGKWNRAWSDLLAPLKSVSTSDDGFGVVFELHRAVDHPERLLTVPLLPAGLHGPLDEPKRQRPLPLGVIGAGPYRLATEQVNSRLIVNEHSVLKPRISEIRIVSAGSRRLAAEYVRLVGDAVTFDVAPEDAALLSRELGGRVLQATRKRIVALAFRAKSTILGDPDVLEAAKRLVNRAELSSRGERFKASAAPVEKRSSLYPAGLVVPGFDAIEAERILWWQGGWKREPHEKWFVRKDAKGATEELSMPLLIDGDDRESVRRAAILSRRFADSGIRLKVDPRPRLEFRSRVSSREFPAALVYLDVSDPGALHRLFHTKGGDNVMGFSNANVDQHLEAGDLKGAVKAIVAAERLLFLGLREDVGAAGKNVLVPRISGRGGMAHVHKWRIQ